MRFRVTIFLANALVLVVGGFIVYHLYKSMNDIEVDLAGLAGRSIPRIDALEHLRFAGLNIVTTASLHATSTVLTNDVARQSEPSRMDMNPGQMDHQGMAENAGEQDMSGQMDHQGMAMNVVDQPTPASNGQAARDNAERHIGHAVDHLLRLQDARDTFVGARRRYEILTQGSGDRDAQRLAVAEEINVSGRQLLQVTSMVFEYTGIGENADPGTLLRMFDNLLATQANYLTVLDGALEKEQNELAARHADAAGDARSTAQLLIGAALVILFIYGALAVLTFRRRAV